MGIVVATVEEVEAVVVTGVEVIAAMVSLIRGQGEVDIVVDVANLKQLCSSPFRPLPDIDRSHNGVSMWSFLFPNFPQQKLGGPIICLL